MKTSTPIAICLSLLLSLSSFAASSKDKIKNDHLKGREGGGGGGQCLSDKCLTLAQAGLRLKPPTKESEAFEIEASVILEVEKIVKMIPLYFLGDERNEDEHRSHMPREDFIDLVINGSYQEVSIENMSQFKDFEKEYIEILKKANFSTENFELLAASDSENSYILPNYHKLDIAGKATLLIHETVIRDFGASVEQALLLDGFLIDLLEQNGNLSKKDKLDLMNLIESISPRLLLSKVSSKLNLLALQSPQEILLEDICEFLPADRSSFENFKSCQVDKMKEAKLRQKGIGFLGLRGIFYFPYVESKYHTNFEADPKDLSCVSNTGKAYWKLVSATTKNLPNVNVLLAVECSLPKSLVKKRTYDLINGN